MNRINALNRRFAEKITSGVSTMAEFEYAKAARETADLEVTEI
jgi:hypothetical protein